jgi:MoxR-like ATPase
VQGSDEPGLADVDWFQRGFDRLAHNIERYIRGKPEVVRLSLVCLFAEGHLLLEDVPGVAKTSLARAIARSITGTVMRVQFTPDLLPSDLTGVKVYDLGRREFFFHEGPVFANIVLGDEINRASPKTQSALLEVMAERQVTISGETRAVPRPFLCIATQNPVEHQGTYALPEAQIDRFMMRLSMGYPRHADEVSIVAGGLERRTPEQLDVMMTIDDMLEMITFVERVYVAPALQDYIVRITESTRRLPDVRLGVSPRGSIALAQCSQAYAASKGRSFATADDVKAVAVPALAHRLILTPEAVVQGTKPEVLVGELLSSIQVPRG